MSKKDLPPYILYENGSESFWFDSFPTWRVGETLNKDQAYALNFGFSWRDTPQDFDYWAGLYRGRRIVQKEDIKEVLLLFEGLYKPLDIKDYL